MARESNKREFLELAQKFEYGKYTIGGWYWSEKLDGIRCYWDGGITTGLPASQVPWANTAKHDRFVDAVISTGLWTRYGQVIRAPEWWYKTLPNLPLDGELYIARGQWQRTASIVRSHNAGIEWDIVNFMVFNSPTYYEVFQDSEINNAFYKKKFSGILPWISARNPENWSPARPFRGIVRNLPAMLKGRAKWLPHHELPLGFTAAENEIRSQADAICDAGGEGLILRAGNSYWIPKRHRELLKVKPFEDAEGTVLGYKFAKPTDLGRSISGIETNKILGLMGSMRVLLDNGKQFDLSGWTDEERILCSMPTEDPVFQEASNEDVRDYGTRHPGEDVPAWIEHPTFPRGSRVTFKYREMSDDGLPKEARFYRKAEEL